MLFSPHYSLASVYTVNTAPWRTLVFFMLYFPLSFYPALSSPLQKSVHLGDTCCFSSLRCTMLSFTSDSACIVASLVAQTVENLPIMPETRVQSLGWKDTLEKGKATHSSILAWRIPWTEEPGELQSMGSQRVGHSWATNTFTFFHQKLEEARNDPLSC